MSQVNEFTAFRCVGRCKSLCLNEITPLLCTLTLQGQYPLFLYSKTLQGAQSGVVAVTDGLVATTSFVFLHGRQPSLTILSVSCPQGHRCETLHQGHRRGAQNQEHLQS